MYTEHTTMSMLLLIGVLAGMWPCGIIILLDELFNAESKSQVCGILHQYISSFPQTANSIRKLIMLERTRQS